MRYYAPSVFDSGVSMLLYFFLITITGFSLWEFAHVKVRKQSPRAHFRSVVPLGWAAAAFGIVGLFIQYQQAFSEIEAAGDISPQIVASAMRTAFSYPVLGFICLGFSYFFRFINQRSGSEPTGQS
jgi:hypothetical protein